MISVFVVVVVAVLFREMPRIACILFFSKKDNSIGEISTAITHGICTQENSNLIPCTTNSQN